MKRLTLILTAWLIPALAGAQGIPIYPQPLFRTSTPIFKGLGPLTGPVILDTTADNTYARQMSPPALTSATPDNGSGSLAAGVYTFTVVGVDLAGGVSLYPTAITCTVTGGTSHCDIVYVAPVGAVSTRVYVSDVDGATPDRYFASTSATTYALTTLVGATVAALPTSNSAYRFSIGGETQNWWSLPMRYESGALGTTETEGLALQNLWPASTATTVQVSPSFSLLGNAYNSTSTLSESHRWFAYVLPATVAGTTTSTLKFGHSLNGGAATYPMMVSNGGLLTLTASDASGAIIRTTGNIAAFRTLANNGYVDVGASAFNLAGIVTLSGLAPTIASGGCTTPAVTWSNGTALFLVTVGTTCETVKTFTLTLPAALHFWGCGGENNTSDAAQALNYLVGRATSTTAVVMTNYSRTTGLPLDFVDSNTYLIKCIGG